MLANQWHRLASLTIPIKLVPCEKYFCFCCWGWPSRCWPTVAPVTKGAANTFPAKAGCRAKNPCKNNFGFLGKFTRTLPARTKPLRRGECRPSPIGCERENRSPSVGLSNRFGSCGRRCFSAQTSLLATYRLLKGMRVARASSGPKIPRRKRVCVYETGY